MFANHLVSTSCTESPANQQRLSQPIGCLAFSLLVSSIVVHVCLSMHVCVVGSCVCAGSNKGQMCSCSHTLWCHHLTRVVVTATHAHTLRHAGRCWFVLLFVLVWLLWLDVGWCLWWLFSRFAALLHDLCKQLPFAAWSVCSVRRGVPRTFTVPYKKTTNNGEPLQLPLYKLLGD